MIKFLYPGGRGSGGGERRLRQRGLYATDAPDLAVDPHSAPAPAGSQPLEIAGRRPEELTDAATRLIRSRGDRLRIEVADNRADPDRELYESGAASRDDGGCSVSQRSGHNRKPISNSVRINESRDLGGGRTSRRLNESFFENLTFAQWTLRGSFRECARDGSLAFFFASKVRNRAFRHCESIRRIKVSSSGSRPAFESLGTTSRQFGSSSNAFLKMGSDSSTRFIVTSETACQ